ncbi:MAG: hypothetical protein ACOYVD_03500, partial [Bacillota bacterium]
LCQRVITAFELAFQEQMAAGSYHVHQNWIAILLKEYYDPMYLYQLEKNTRKILFKGNTQEAYSFLKSFSSGKILGVAAK